MELSGATISSAKDFRLENARLWLQKQGANLQSGFHSVAGDASFRRYFRVQVGADSRILMDAAPPAEDVRPFIDIDQRLRAAGLHAPEILYADHANGYLLLEDFGDVLYRELLHEDNADTIFPALFDVLKTLALEVDTENLPEFDYRKLRRDMDLSWTGTWATTVNRWKRPGLTRFGMNFVQRSFNRPRINPSALFTGIFIPAICFRATVTSLVSSIFRMLLKVRSAMTLFR